MDALLTTGGRAPLSVVAEMLDSLETLTLAGRRHVMDKVLGLLTPAAGVLDIEPLLESLGREARRPVPGAAEFRRDAALVLGALATAAG